MQAAIFVTEQPDAATALGIIYEAYKRLWHDLLEEGSPNTGERLLRDIFYNLQGDIARQTNICWFHERPLEWVLTSALAGIRKDEERASKIRSLLDPSDCAVTFIRRLWSRHGEADRLHVSLADALAPYIVNPQLEYCAYDSVFQRHEDNVEEAYIGTIVRTQVADFGLSVVHHIGDYAYIDLTPI